IPATQDLDLSRPEILILAGIRSCVLESINRLNMPRYSKLGAYEVVDMSCVQCLVACIPCLSEQGRPKAWSIADRTGAAQSSIYVPDN
ncbi:hypothetical protein FIBSPDRAFT_756619, partial [Athelia psychrophila]